MRPCASRDSNGPPAGPGEGRTSYARTVGSSAKLASVACSWVRRMSAVRSSIGLLLKGGSGYWAESGAVG